MNKSASQHSTYSLIWGFLFATCSIILLNVTRWVHFSRSSKCSFPRVQVLSKEPSTSTSSKFCLSWGSTTSRFSWYLRSRRRRVWKDCFMLTEIWVKADEDYDESEDLVISSALKSTSSVKSSLPLPWVLAMELISHNLATNFALISLKSLFVCTYCRPLLLKVYSKSVSYCSS